MDKEHIKGAAKKVEGELKETAGELTDDKSLQAEGKADKVE
ncbi:MAG: CsbD family protein, partial [Pseudomonadota bacterium]